jgi:hypothetical protein
MTGPRPKPLLLSDEDYVMQEIERITLEEASDPRYQEPPETPEFGPGDYRDEERVERETDRMLAQEDLQLYAEFGVVR